MSGFWNWMTRGASSRSGSKARSGRHRGRRLLLESLDARRVLASAYQNPGQVFDVNNDTYVDREDIRLSEVKLATDGEGKLPTTRDHYLIPFYDVNGDGSFTKQDLADLRKQVALGAATTSIKLANDSGNKLDRTTNDVRIDGRVMGFDRWTRVFAWFEGGVNGPVDVTQLVGRDGAFHLSIHDLHRINGRIFADGNQKMLVQSYDRFGRTSGAVDYSFTIDRKGPEAFNLDANVFEAPQGTESSKWIVRWVQNDAKSYDLRITSDAAGKNTVLYEHDLHQIHANRHPISGLGAGTYYVWLTGFDESGNRTEATGSGQRVDWAPTYGFRSPPLMNPANFSTVAAGFTTTDLWSAVWSPHSSDVINNKIVVTRDPQGTDVAYEKFLGKDVNQWGFIEVDLSHLAKGSYYVFISEYRSGGQWVTICDGAQVVWNPNRPDDFSIEEPGFVIGDSLDLQWEAAAGAATYEVVLHRASSPEIMYSSHLVFQKDLSRDQWRTYYEPTYDELVGGYQATTNHLLLENLAEGQYIVEIIARDSQGRATLSRNVSEFSVDADGVIDNVDNYASIEVGKIGDQVIINASATLSGLVTKRFEIYTSPDLAPEHLLVSQDAFDQPGISLPLSTAQAYPMLYVKVSYFDYKGVRISLPDPIVIDTAKIADLRMITVGYLPSRADGQIRINL